MREQLKQKLYDTASDIIIKKGQEFIDNPSGFNWNMLFAALGGSINGCWSNGTNWELPNTVFIFAYPLKSLVTLDIP